MNDFPNAPYGWSLAVASEELQKSGLEMNDDYKRIIRALQSYFASHENPNRRELTDALEEAFHIKGGMKYLYKLLPKGPVAQGCKLAGLTPPAGSVDESFGSVV